VEENLRFVESHADAETEASRAKHKFAVKRNSWPKTRGVAMNPVDHVRLGFQELVEYGKLTTWYSPTVVVTINISVKPRQSHDLLRKVKRPVSLLRGELVCCVVLRRRKIRGMALELVVGSEAVQAREDDTVQGKSLISCSVLFSREAVLSLLIRLANEPVSTSDLAYIVRHLGDFCK